MRRGDLARVGKNECEQMLCTRLVDPGLICIPPQFSYSILFGTSWYLALWALDLSASWGSGWVSLPKLRFLLCHLWLVPVLINCSSYQTISVYNSSLPQQAVV